MTVSEGSVRVGPAGWSYEDWKGIVYPLNMGRSTHPLVYLSTLFDAVEINTSFYRPLNPRHSAAWVRNVAENPQFNFTLKLWQRFTHERDTWPSAEELALVRDGMAPLAESGRLGALLIQFPWSYKRTPANRQWLARVLDAFAAYPQVVEVRHESWNRKEVFDGLAERGVAFCNIDQPLFRDSLSPTDEVTARVGYVRLHGRNAQEWFREGAGRDDRYDYLYSQEELEPWLEKVARIRAKTDETYVITNNHYRGQAVVNALELQARLGKKPVKIPPDLVETYPRLKVLRDG